MMGCNERETVAEAVVEFLSESDDWATPIDWSAIEPKLNNSEWLLDHSHPDGYTCNFISDYTDNGRVNEDFIRCVTRSDDHSQIFPDAVILSNEMAEDLLESLLELLGKIDWYKNEPRRGYADEHERLTKLKEDALRIIRQ
jgi:hypothetical protein